MRLEKIEKVYKTKNDTIIALNDINYNFKRGTFYAITGKSGSGKSTLISILGLIEKQTSGKYYINNKDISNLTDLELSNLRMKEIGFIFQDFYLDQYLTASENVVLPMLINKEIPSQERVNKAFDLLKKVGLETRAAHFPKELSGGEQQRVCIARALANNPNIILADEPTGNLDSENEKNIFNILKDLSKSGKCVIVVSHSQEIKKYADVILNIDNGKLVS